MPDHGADENPRANPESGPEPERKRERDPGTTDNTGHTENTVSGGVHDDALVIQGDEVNVHERSYGDHHDYRGATFVSEQHVHHHPSHEVDWPVRVGAVPGPAPHFRPRAMTGELQRALGHSGTLVLRQVLSGTGGVGKTQLAAHYARTLARITDPENRVDVLLWTDASSAERITTAYAQAARFLFPEIPDDPEEAAKLFLTWLGDPNKNDGRAWLVVWDDLTDPAKVDDLWPPADQPNGRVLVTTRRRDHRLSVQGRELIDVDVYSPEEARDFLSQALNEAGISYTDQHMHDLGEALGYLPLALNQAVSYMAELELDCPAYLELFHDRMLTLAEVFPDWESPTPLAATWELSVEQADRYTPKGMARPLMGLIALLDGTGIPKDVLTSNPIAEYLDEQESSSELRAHQVRMALANLQRLSLISRWLTAPEPETRLPLVQCHQLVQRATREHHLTRPSYTAVHAVADGLLNVWPEIERDTTLAQQLRDNTHVLRGHHRAEGGSTEAWLWEPEPGGHVLLFQAGNSLDEAGRVNEAVTYWTNMSEFATEYLGPDHPHTLTTRHNLASAYGHVGDTAHAIQAYEELLNDRLRVLGPNHTSTLTTQANLAHWHAEAGNTAHAIQAYEELLNGFHRALGPNHSYTLYTRANLADCYGEAGHTAHAIQAYEELLNDQLRVLRPNHPDILATRNHLVRWHGKAGHTAHAIELGEALLNDLHRVLGPDHLETFTTRNLVAHFYGDSGHATQAIELGEELLNDQLRVLGPDHPETLTTRNNLASRYGQAGYSTHAIQAYKELLNDQLRIIGPNHPKTLTTRHNLAVTIYESGDIDRGMELLISLVSDRQRILGADNPDTKASKKILLEWLE